MRCPQRDRSTNSGIPLVRYRASHALPKRLRKRSARFLSLPLSAASWASEIGCDEPEKELEDTCILTAKLFIASCREAA
ncbi:MAG: hypothetical protein AAFR12_22785 [Cyanobacteria bacterium J06626_6]